MNPVVLVLAALFAVAGYQEARRFERVYGQTPWRWKPWIWAIVMFLSWVVGLILLAIAERQGRKRPALSQMPSKPMFAATAPLAFSGHALAATTPTTTASVPGYWAADPAGRHQYRWWDGQGWTSYVASNGISGTDPL
jgi:Protein of unknown function (DUF2510)